MNLEENMFSMVNWSIVGVQYRGWSLTRKTGELIRRRKKMILSPKGWKRWWRSMLKARRFQRFWKRKLNLR